MLKIRLQRVGRRNDPSFRMVVVNSTEGPKSGKWIEQVGTHNALQKQTTIQKDRVAYWMKEGAQTSDTVHNLLVKEGVIEGKKINVLPKKKPIMKEEEQVEAKEEAPAPQTEASPTEEVKEAEQQPTAPEAPAEEVKSDTPANEETPVKEN